MYSLIRLLNWGGAGSIALGGLLGLVAFFKGREARQLEAATPVQSLAALKNLINLVPLLVAISGRVWADKPVKGRLSTSSNPPVEAAIVQETEERVSERRTMDLVWVKESDLVRSVVCEAEWGLEDGSGVRVPVVMGQDASGNFMRVTGEDWQPASERVVGVVLGEISGRRYLGARRQERALPLGDPVTAVGELAAVLDSKGFQGALRSRGLMYVLRRPTSGGPFVITRQQLPDLIASLKATSSTCQRLSLAFTALGASMLLLSAAQQAAAWWRQKRLRSRIEQTRRARSEAAAAAAAAGGEAAAQGGDGAVGLGAGAVCVVCFHEEPNMVFPSCGHLCVCSSCGRSLGRCPICRSRGGPIRVYTP